MTMTDADRPDLPSQAAAPHPRPADGSRMPLWRVAAGISGIVLLGALVLPWWWNSNGGMTAFEKLAAMSQQEQEDFARRQKQGNEYIKSRKEWLDAHKDTLQAKVEGMNDRGVDLASGFTLRLMGWDVWQGVAACGMGAAIALPALGLSAFRPREPSPLWLCLAGIGLSIAALGVAVRWWWQVPKFDFEPVGSMGAGIGVCVASAGAAGGLVSCTIGLLVRRRKREGTCEEARVEAAG